MLEEILKRVDQRLKELKLTPSKASLQAGLSRDAIRNMKRAVGTGRDGISTHTLERLAEVLEVTPAWLIGGNEPIPHDGVTLNKDRRDEINAPVVGWVQAGVWQEPSELEPDMTDFRVITASTRYPHAQHLILDVKGDSFNMLAPEGSKVIVIPWSETGLLTPLNKQVIVAEESEAPFDVEGGGVEGPIKRTLKRVRIERETVWLEPESDNPTHKPIKLTRQTRAFGLVVSIIRDLEY